MCIVNLIAILKFSVRFSPNSPHIFVDNIPRLNRNLVYCQSAHDAPFVRVTERPRMPTHFELEGNILPTV